ncbi:MAG TPA: efflux transporter outer membrane subunit [Steroidobacteraceae bacterium]|nr:efflux transporter outer membrane subunit [Steroidobacteraceae bacterium]
MSRMLVAACCALLAGCATRVPQVLSPPLVPQAFVGQEAALGSVWPKPDWWQQFGSPELSDFILRAQNDNRDLAVAAASVVQAHAQTVIQRASLFPQLNLQAQAQRSKLSAVSSGISNYPAGNEFGVNLAASYEIDVWGLARSNLRAATEALKAARFGQQAVALTVTANVASAYFNVLALRSRISIANEDIAAINDILGTIQLRVTTGTSSHLDLAQERAQVESVEAELPELQEQELEARVALAVLLGQTPETLDVKAPSLESIHPPLMNPGLPSDLLLRRPDVAQAEANLASAHASVDAARAAFLPQFALTGSDGFASAAIGTLLHGPSVAWDYGGSLLQTIFDGGKLVGQKKLAEGTQQQLIATYQKAVLNAYADVETALGQVKHYDLAEQHLGHEVDAAREAFQISQLQYRQGTTDLLTVLQSQQTLFSAEDQLAQISLARMQSVVHLYEALGGGWMEQSGEQTQFTTP